MRLFLRMEYRELYLKPISPQKKQAVPRVELNMVKTIRGHMQPKRTMFLSRAIILGFVATLLAGLQSVQAQYTEDGQPFILVSPINIISPSNSTYGPQSLVLNITFKSFLDSSRADITIVYCIDGNTNATISTELKPVPMGIQSYYVINGSVTLPEMQEGPHCITVYGKYEFPMAHHNIAYDNSTIYFTINDGNPPVISDLSVQNKTYSQGNLILTFTLDEPTSWTGYCVDGQANVTMTGNLTLTGIAPGSHTLIVYANDTVGNMGRSETVYFEIAQPFPKTSLLAVAAVIVTVLTCSLAYLQKRHKQENTNSPRNLK